MLIDKGFRSEMAAVLLSATAAVVGVTTPPAAALPDREWDIGAYDDCVRKADNDYVNGVTNDRQYGANLRLCCLNSGGVWSGPTVGAPTYGGCGAPPARTDEGAPIAPGATEGVSDDPTGTPLPTPSPRPTPPGAPTAGVG